MVASSIAGFSLSADGGALFVGDSAGFAAAFPPIAEGGAGYEAAQSWCAAAHAARVRSGSLAATAAAALECAVLLPQGLALVRALKDAMKQLTSKRIK
jgi:hypothetical protein